MKTNNEETKYAKRAALWAEFMYSEQFHRHHGVDEAHDPTEVVFFTSGHAKRVPALLEELDKAGVRPMGSGSYPLDGESAGYTVAMIFESTHKKIIEQAWRRTFPVAAAG